VRAALDVDRLRSELGPRWPRIDVVESTSSTNTQLLADLTAPDRTVLAAEVQTSGRGRLDRVWTSPPMAGLTFSALIRPGIPVLTWGWLPLLAGVALAEAVSSTTGVEATLKWPNDLLLGADAGKAAGILVQSSGEAAVVGIGLNVSTTADELPVPTATSLAVEGVRSLDRTELLIAILTRLDARVAQWVDCGGDAAACGLAAAYRERCATIGSPVRVAIADGTTLEGRAVDIDELGRIVVRPDDGGANRVIGAGDVEHLRTA
jgi:BirA family biotin operon repressor/biotin-[acetyl-CoA-carboxylase] ligase